MEYNNFATFTAAMTVKSGCCSVIFVGPLPRRIASTNVPGELVLPRVRAMTKERPAIDSPY